uniref:Uncharacterized protein n=1 Tax=Aegilops tauschii TaxID=37682 RepID=R7W2V3_AEGTA
MDVAYSVLRIQIKKHGVDCERCHLRAGFFSAYAVEEGKGEGRAISAAGCGGGRTGEGGKEAVQGAPGDRGGLPQQFVEQGRLRLPRQLLGTAGGKG